MVTTDDLLQELEQEAQTTRRVLERVPNEKLTWRPHEKARTLGELAMHVATVAGAVAELFGGPTPAQLPQFTDPAVNNASELLPALEESLGKAKKVLNGMDQAAFNETWRLMHGEREIFALPRAALLRSIMLNHWYHHRGQLSVYLKQLDVLSHRIMVRALTKIRLRDAGFSLECADLGAFAGGVLDDAFPRKGRDKSQPTKAGTSHRTQRERVICHFIQLFVNPIISSADPGTALKLTLGGSKD